MAAVTAYGALVKEAAAIGWPLAYRRDLTVHDRAACRRLKPGQRFVWSVRETGTDLYVLGEASVAWARAQRSGQRWYLWTGSELRALRGKEEAVSILEEADVSAGERGAA